MKKPTTGIVRIKIRVGVLVMRAMMRGPPQGASLRTCLRKEREHELECTTGFVRAMRKVAVKSTCHSEHANKVEHDANDPISLAGSSHERAQRCQV